MSADIDALIAQAAARYNLDHDMFRRQLMRESGLDPNAINRVSGAAGIGQFMPATARGMGIDPMDPAQAVPAAALYMRQNLNQFGGDYDKALAAYNWGPGNVASKGLAAMPAETRNYIAAIRGGSGSGPPVAAMAAPVPATSPALPTTPPVGPASQPAALPLPPPDNVIGAPTLADMFALAARKARGLT